MKTERLTTAESLMLDVVRISASAVVAFGHLTQPYFSSGWRDYTNVARGAVAVFFILSGFVIRHVTLRRSESLGSYFGDRASRIYSVAIPALLLTLLLDAVSITRDPTFYHHVTGDSNHPFGRVLLNLAFLGQLWNNGINPLSDNPYWSINYEVAYYVAYGLFFYLAGTRRFVGLALLALLEGPRVLFLGLLWWFGCLTHDMYQRWNAARTTAANLNRLLLGGVVLALVAFAARHAVHAPALAALRASIAASLASSSFVHIYMTSKRISNLNFLFGLVFAALLLKLLQLVRNIALSPTSPTVRAIRFISEGTFPIYLLHYPIYVFIAACLPYNHARPVPKLLIFLLVLTLGVLAGHPANLLKTRLRTLLHRRPLPKLTA